MARQENLPTVLEWDVYESLHGDRTIDWFWGVGLAGVIIGIVAIIINNILLAVLAIVGTIAMIIAALKHPELHYYALTTRGVVKNESLYPWSELDVFWILESDPAMLLVKPKVSTAPIIQIPLPETADTQIVHDYLFQYIDDEPLRIGTMQNIMNRLGFY